MHSPLHGSFQQQRRHGRCHRSLVYSLRHCQHTGEPLYIPLWGCPSILLSENGPKWCAQLATTVYKLLGAHKLTIRAYGGDEHVSHTIVQMLAMVCTEHQNDWGVYLAHVEYAHNNSISAATSLTLKIHISHLPRVVIDHTVVLISVSTVTSCDFVRKRQQHTCELREQHAPASLMSSCAAPNT